MVVSLVVLPLLSVIRVAVIRVVVIVTRRALGQITDAAGNDGGWRKPEPVQHAFQRFQEM